MAYSVRAVGTIADGFIVVYCVVHSLYHLVLVCQVLYTYKPFSVSVVVGTIADILSVVYGVVHRLYLIQALAYCVTVVGNGAPGFIVGYSVWGGYDQQAP